MTILHPHQNKSLLNAVIGALISAIFLGSLWLIWLYNSSVNLEHGISDLNAQIKDLETKNAESQDKIFRLFSTQNLADTAKEKNLIIDKNPQYLRVGVENDKAVALQP